MSNRTLTLIAFIIGVLGIGTLIGMACPPGAWHAALIKPSFNPPNWIFAPVWTTLYVLIGIAGWRVFVLGQDSGLRRLWILQMVLNFAWSPAFFGLQNLALGLIVIIPMLIVILAFIWRAKDKDPISAGLFLPYALWVAFASALTLALNILN